MYQAVLVDNEPFILNTVKKIISLNSLGVEVAAAFTSTIEAHEYIKIHPTDLIITEACMPDMTGIELIEKAKLYNSNTMYIILSSHDSFQYATAAMRLGVSDYILKPTNNNVLCDAIKNVVAVLDSGKINNDTNYSIFKDMNTSLSFALNEMSAEEFLESIKKEGYGITYSNPCACIIKFKVKNLLDYLGSVWKYSLDRLYPAIVFLMTATASDRVIFIPLNYAFSNLTLIAVMKDDEYSSLQKITKLCEKIVKNVMDCIKADICFTDIKFFSSLDTLQKIAPFYTNLDEKKHNMNINPILHAKKYIQDNYYNDISLAEVAKTSCLSPHHFSRLFKKETGQNFTVYLNNIRLEMACDLILNTNENISSIYSTVGFNSKNYFYKLFKNRFGVTPLEYKKRAEQ